MLLYSVQARKHVFVLTMALPVRATELGGFGFGFTVVLTAGELDITL